MDDVQILDLFWSRSERAITETAEKYGAYCHAVARRILESPQDCEECLNDAYWRAWDAIPPQRPDTLRAFLGRIVRNLALDRVRHDRAQKRGGGQLTVALEELSDCVPASAGVEQAAEDRQLAQCLDRFLGLLPRETRIIFLRRYWYLCSVAEIARSTGCGESKIKMSLLRTRRRLKTFLEKEGVTL